MTLFRNCAVLRLMCGFPFAPIQILTGDTREGCNARCGRLHDDGRSFQRKSRIERRFESSPESRGSQTSGVLLVLFVQAKRIKPFPLREIRGFTNLESAHPNNDHALTQLNPSPLCDDYFPTFCKTQKVGQKNARSRRAAENVRTKKEELAIESNTLILTACCC